MKNNTQPNRDQPWYQVLVDGGHETYVAQTSLETDTSKDPIHHPGLTHIFTSFVMGRYYPLSKN
jgi:hemimethylated DNA binding protein